MDNSPEQIKNWLKKIEEGKQGKLDLSLDEDLSIAIMNLVSIEEHFFFTGAKTGKKEYFALLDKTREMRKELLKKIVKEPEGETYCIMKHLLAASMRLMEVGAKHLHQNQKKEADEMFEKAYQLYSLFWGVNLKLVATEEIKKIDEGQLNAADKKRTGFLGKLGELVQKIVDCCIE